MPRDPMEFVVGDRVPGTKWVMRGKLGEGGMGVVLDVVKEPGIPGAMKIMHPWFARRPEFVTRFFDEVRLLAQLRHPNIVQVFDFDRLDDGTPYVVMERLLGVTLRAGLRNLREKRTPVSAKLVYEITRQLCEGLFRAHSNTPVIVHRDVKPENIFFHQPDFADTVVKVIDFGIAAVLDGTRDRRVFGTPRHMAPEQIRGHAVSPATDVYAAALVLYELLTGRFPWDIDLRDELTVVEAHLHMPPAPPSRFTPWVPQLVDQWVLRALSKDPADRPQDAYQFVAKLYELQFVNDGTSDSLVDINTTAPTLARLAEAVEGTPGAQTKRDDTVDTAQGMALPPVEGTIPDLAPEELTGGWPDTAWDPAPSRPVPVRAAEGPTRPEAGVDRQAPTQTRTLSPGTRRGPKTDTPVYSFPEGDEASATDAREPERARMLSEAPVASTVPPEESRFEAPRGLPRGAGAWLARDGVLPAVLGSTLVVGLFVTILVVNRPPPGLPVTSAATARAAAAQVQSARADVPPPVPVAATETPRPSAVPVPAPPPAPTAAADREAPTAAASPEPAASTVPVVRALPRPSSSPRPPDDGRELLYVRP